MNVAIVGGGINGLCSAWQLALSGHKVTLFERGKLLGETSTSSSKLLHGGIRYLENLEFCLVKEALKERAWWLQHVPQYTSAVELYLPIYEQGRRSAWKVKLGLMLYDWLAGAEKIDHHQCIAKKDIQHSCSELKQRGLHKVYTFFDGQMDENKLGEWVADQAREAGAQLMENSEVTSFSESGVLCFNGCQKQFDKVINVAGPWSSTLNKKSRVSSQYELDLIRGSHIMLNRQIAHGYLLEVPGERRIFFVLPYQNQTLVGTTEVRQTLNEPIQCSEEEKVYLLDAYNYYFVKQATESDVIGTFAGVRPLIKSSDDPGKVTREYAIERKGSLINVFGGKWTTARALAKKIVQEVNLGCYK